MSGRLRDEGRVILVGLARLEFILTAQVGIHPLALVWFDELKRFVET